MIGTPRTGWSFHGATSLATASLALQVILGITGRARQRETLPMTVSIQFLEAKELKYHRSQPLISLLSMIAQKQFYAVSEANTATET